jgi:DNA-directed RNA polymerase specialized sigma24 family protein
MNEGIERAEAPGISDALAVERTLGGDRHAYRVLVERYSRNVYQMAYRMTGNTHDAEEVVQEAFLRGYKKLSQFAGNANFGTWVYRIGANYAIDTLRQTKGTSGKTNRRWRRNRCARPGAGCSSLAGTAGGK